MNESSLPPPAETPDVIRLARAVRFVLVCTQLGFAIYCLRSSFQIEILGQIIKDMLGENTQLPVATRIVLSAEWLFIGLSVILPTISFLQLFSRKVIQSIYVIGITSLALVIESVVLHIAMSSPWLEVVKRLSAGPGD
jgi:hypothetical protein